MAIFNDPNVIRELLETLLDKDVSVPCFCAENTFTMEGILMGARQFAADFDLADVPLYIAATANYHGRQQLANYTSLNDTREGFLTFRSDLERLARPDGPFADIRVIPALDHGQPEGDVFLFDQGRDFWGCVMYDCSTRPLAENIDRTAEFVTRYKDAFVIEGCVDEITESGQGDMKLTDPNDAKNFIDRTGVDLIVANLGTEHRVTGEKKKYHGDLARQICNKVGRRIVLHGTSCLSQHDLMRLRTDGIAKVNIWTVLETQTSQDMLVKLIEQAPDILPPQKIDELNARGLLGPNAADVNKHPKLEYLTELYRRNAIKTPSVAKITYEFMKAFGH